MAMNRKAKLITTALGALCMALVPVSVLAAEVRQADVVTIAKEQKVTGNKYYMAGDVTIDGDVDGDVVVFANSLTITGKVTGSVIALANQVEINGAVGGSIRVISLGLHVRGDVGQDITGITGQLALGKEAHVHGIVAYGSSQVNLDGRIDGSRYDILRSRPVVSTADELYALAQSFLAWSLVGVILYSLQGYMGTESLYFSLRTRYLRHFGLGFAAVLFGGACIVFLLLSGIGRILGLCVLAGTMVCALLAVIDSAYALGRMLVFREQPLPNRVTLVFLVGNLILISVLRLPVIFILPLALIMASLGNRLRWFLSIITHERTVHE
jgi:cytoskeletal protein CcmA (bactofilin family)